jgi:hypothetical protein
VDRAEAAYWANAKVLREAQTGAANARDAQQQLRKDADRLAVLDAQRREKLALVEKLDQEVKGKIQPLPVDPTDSISTTLGDDTRPLNALIALIAVVGIFGTLMYADAHQSERLADEEHFPFAAAAYADEFAEPAPRFADIDAAARAAGLTVNPDPFDPAFPEDGATESGRSVAV